MLILFFQFIFLFWLVLALASFFIPESLTRALMLFNALFTAVGGLIALVGQQSFTIGLSYYIFSWGAQLHIDSLSAFFISLMGISLIGVMGFVLEKKVQAFCCLFVLAMLVVFSAHDALTFLFAWECMTLASYFLVVSITPSKLNRRAGFLYLS